MYHNDVSQISNKKSSPTRVVGWGLENSDDRIGDAAIRQALLEVKRELARHHALKHRSPLIPEAFFEQSGSGGYFPSFHEGENPGEQDYCSLSSTNFPFSKMCLPQTIGESVRKHKNKWET